MAEEAGAAQKLSLQMLLKAMIDKGASDLHVTAGTPPQLRIDGRLVPLRTATLTPVDTRQLCYSVLTDDQKHTFEEESELDLSFGVKSLARFRANIYSQRGAVAGAFRQIPYVIESMESLNVPMAMAELMRRPSGLVLITGPTGSGKSTTLASIIDLVNTERHGHIITIEDPIEYLHSHKSCIVTQREVGTDTKTFKAALKYVLRQDPDVVLIGELRDLETVEAALTIAETGHLTIGTLHTNSAVQTINRIVDVFPPFQQPQVRSQLALVLHAVLSQQLIPKIGGGRALATELLIPNSGVRSQIRDNKVHQIYSQMQVGRAKYAMHTLNQSLAELVNRRVIRSEDAVAKSPEPDELRQILLQGSSRAPA